MAWPIGWRAVRKLSMCVLERAVASHAAWLWTWVVGIVKRRGIRLLPALQQMCLGRPYEQPLRRHVAACILRGCSCEWFCHRKEECAKTCGSDLAGNMGILVTCGSRRWQHGARAGNLRWLLARKHGLGHWWLCNSLV